MQHIPHKTSSLNSSFSILRHKSRNSNFFADFWKELRFRNPVLVNRALEIYDRSEIHVSDAEFSRDEFLQMMLDFIRAIPEIQRHVLKIGRPTYYQAIYEFALDISNKMFDTIDFRKTNRIPMDLLRQRFSEFFDTTRIAGSGAVLDAATKAERSARFMSDKHIGKHRAAAGDSDSGESEEDEVDVLELIDTLSRRFPDLPAESAEPADSNEDEQSNEAEEAEEAEEENDKDEAANDKDEEEPEISREKSTEKSMEKSDTADVDVVISRKAALSVNVGSDDEINRSFQVDERSVEDKLAAIDASQDTIQQSRLRHLALKRLHRRRANEDAGLAHESDDAISSDDDTRADIEASEAAEAEQVLSPTFAQVLRGTSRMPSLAKALSLVPGDTKAERIANFARQHSRGVSLQQQPFLLRQATSNSAFMTFEDEEYKEDDELDDEEDDMIDFAEIAFRVMEHKETLAAAARAGGVAGSVAKRPQAPRGMGLGAGRAGNSTLSSPRGGLAGSETIRAQKVAKVIARFRKELNAYKLGTLYAMKSLPPHEVFKNILTKPPENRLEAELHELLVATRNNKFFQSFSIPDTDRMEVCRVLGFLETPAHGLVFEQGSRGDTFYIVLVGSVSVTVYDPVRDLHTKIADLKFGDSFGELALMTDEPRAATIRAGGQGAMFATLDRSSYLQTLKVFQDKLHLVKSEFLIKCPILLNTPLKIVHEIALFGHLKTVHRDTVVIQQGDAAMSGVFFVKSGSLRVIQEIKDANGTSRFLEVNQLGPYSFFGEYAFVHRCTRSASVIANSACELVELGRFDWLRRVDPDTLSAAAELTLQYPDERTVRAMSTQSSNWEAFRSKLVACTVNRGKEHISDIRMGDVMNDITGGTQHAVNALFDMLNSREDEELPPSTEELIAEAREQSALREQDWWAAREAAAEEAEQNEQVEPIDEQIPKYFKRTDVLLSARDSMPDVSDVGNTSQSTSRRSSVDSTQAVLQQRPMLGQAPSSPSLAPIQPSPSRRGLATLVQINSTHESMVRVWAEPPTKPDPVQTAQSRTAAPKRFSSSTYTKFVVHNDRHGRGKPPMQSARRHESPTRVEPPSSSFFITDRPAGKSIRSHK